MSVSNRLGVAFGGLILTAVLAIPQVAIADPVDDVVGGAQSAIGNTVASVAGVQGGSGGSAAPAPAAGIPPDYTPPLHGDNPHGQGTGATVDFTPSNTLPLSGDPVGGTGEDEEDIVVGRSRGEQDDNGDYHGQIVIAALFGNEIVPGVETNEGEQDSGPLGPINEELCPLNGGGSPGLSLCLLAADSETTDNGSQNRFKAVGVNAGGLTETVVPGVTGQLVADGDLDALAEALAYTDFTRFDASRVRSNAERFSRQAFQRRLVAEVRRAQGLPDGPGLPLTA